MERICSLRSRLLPLFADPIFEELGLPGKYHISLAIRQVVFFFQNNPKYLDLSYKTDLDFLDCFEWGNPHLIQNFIGLINIIWGLSREKKSPFNS